MKSLYGFLVICLLATTASAYPIAYDDEPEEKKPPAINKLGFRIGFGRIPTDDLPLGMLQLTIGIEHPVFAKLRVFGEYDWLWVSEVPEEEMPEQEPVSTMGHRTNLGLRRVFAEKRFDIIRLYADIEVGGGLGLYGGQDQVYVLPHGLVGLRFGYAISKSVRTRGTFETEVNIRAIFVENGVGIGGGLGFYWGN